MKELVILKRNLNLSINAYLPSRTIINVKNALKIVQYPRNTLLEGIKQNFRAA